MSESIRTYQKLLHEYVDAQAVRDREIKRLRAINAELLAVVQRLINCPGLADYNAALRDAHRLIAKAKGEKLQPMSDDHLIIRLRRAFDETGNFLLSDAIEELAHRSAINAELVAALEWIAEDGATDARATECARAAIVRAKP